MKWNRSLLLLLMVCVHLHAKEFVLTKMGVLNDSTKLQTAAIQKVIDEAAAEGGGEIVVPEGVFLTGALFFKSGTSLRVEAGGVIKGSDHIADYPLVPSRMEGKLLEYYAALINVKDVDGFSISGKGTINGNGEKFWKYFWQYRDSLRALKQPATNLGAHRPRLLFFWRCNNLTLQDVRLCNAGFWTTHLYQCNNVVFQNLEIYSPYKPVPAPSTDGIDLDVCSHVRISHCSISVNDDAVCIKGGKGPWADTLPENGIVDHVLIEQCRFGDSHGVLTLGSEAVHARDIVMRHCTVESTAPVLRMKRRPDTPQIFEDVKIEDVTGQARTLLTVMVWKQFFDMEDRTTPTPCRISNISFSDIQLKCSQLAEYEVTSTDEVKNFSFSHIGILAATDSIPPALMRVSTFTEVAINGKGIH